MASCSRDWPPEPQSFPRKACPELAEGRESALQTFRGAPITYWIPGFAGMTGVRGRDTLSKRRRSLVLRAYKFFFGAVKIPLAFHLCLEYYQ